MRKRVVLALLLVLVLLVTASCKLIAKDQEVDDNTVIIEVAGQQFTKVQVAAEVESVLNTNAYYYYMYGLSYDMTDATHIASARDTAAKNLIQQAVIAQKEQEMGIALTDEELATVTTEAETTYAGYVDTVRTNYFADTELTGDELETAVLQMTEQYYGTKDALIASKTESAVYQKLKDTVVAGVTATDEEIETQYNTAVSTAMETYASDPTSYITAVGNGSTIYYVPSGFRYVKNLLLNLEAADSTAITDMSTKLTDATSQLSSVETAIAELPADAATDTADQAASRASLATQKTDLEGQVTDYTAQLAQLKTDAYAKLQPTIDEILAKLAAGETFDAMVEQYGQDSGMKVSPAKEEGYLVCAGNTKYVTEFTDAAMQLAKVGDVSAAAVQTSFGLHLLQYASDVTPGVVPFAAVKEQVGQEVLASKQNTEFTNTVTAWVDASDAKTYLNRLDQ